VRSFGHVKSYDADRGYGFIVDDDTDEEYYVHHSGLEGVRALSAGQAVEFETVRKGRETQAVHVIVL
jgi:CspA family cold shock protein